MFTSSFLTTAILSVSAQALPSQLARRDPCDWQNAEPILYHSYDSVACPPRLVVDSRGDYPMKLTERKPGTFICAGFCQESTEYYYGRETIFLANPYCHGPMTCAIQETKTVQVQYSFSSTIGAKVNEIFNLGISGGVSKTTSTARAQTKAVSLKEGQCGYFTFIPIFKKSCGTWTQGDLSSRDWKTCIDPDTYENQCAYQPVTRPGFGNDPAGDTIFVWVDCETHKPLPMSKQDPAYNHPEVPLPRAQYDEFDYFFEGGNPEDDWMTIANEWRKKMKMGELKQSEMLEKNAAATVFAANGELISKLHDGTWAEVLSPGEATGFEKSFAGWVCEDTSIGDLKEACGEMTGLPDSGGMLGHAEILAKKGYSHIGCAFAAGVWACDLGKE